jgi:hypothetical protein
MRLWVCTNRKALLFQAQGLVGNLENTKNMQRQFSYDVLIVCRPFSKGVVIILTECYVRVVELDSWKISMKPQHPR